jgi:hypothetical protein
MRIFGRSIGGGRRQSPREALPIAVTVSSLHQTREANVVDLSATGARLQGLHLPAAGEPVSLWMETVRVFGAVAWVHGNQCGLEFDPPLPGFEVERLKREVRRAALSSAGLAALIAPEPGRRQEDSIRLRS